MKNLLILILALVTYSTYAVNTPKVPAYPDSDGDKVPKQASMIMVPIDKVPPGFVVWDATINVWDCDDNDKNTYPAVGTSPAAKEIADKKDNNCNGLIDEGIIILYTFYADSDGDGYGNQSVSVQSEKQPAGYVTDNSDCNDKDNSINPAGVDGCNTDKNCNGVHSEGVPQKLWYLDSDKDGYGNASTFVLSCADVLVNYVLIGTDCNDTNSNINPGKEEVLNGLDDNCNGTVDEGLIVAGWKLTKKKKLLPEYLGAGGASGMFVNNSPSDQSFIDLMLSGNFSAYVGPVEGHESSYSHWKLPYGTKGNGYNPPLPCDPRPMNGELCKVYSQDFFLSYVDFCRKTSTKAIYVANIQTGTLSDIYYFIDQFPTQSSIVIAYGLEGFTNNYPVLTSKTYVVKYYEWMDSVNKKYPTRQIYHLADIPDVRLKNGKYNSWVQDFLNYRPIDSTKVSLRSYYHGYEQYGPLTRDAVKDSLIYSNGMPVFVKTITDMETAFKGCSNMVMQFSTDVPSYVSGQPLNGRCVDMFYYLRAQKVMIDRTISGQSNFLGTSIIGVKLLTKSLNYKWISILNNMFLVQRTAVDVSYLGPQVDAIGGYYNGVYSLTIQNRSGVDVPLPEYIQLDDEIVKPKYVKSVGYMCESLSSTTGTEFNPLVKNKIEEFSIVYLEIEQPK